mgnify:CR=1 FL=1
MRAAVVGVTGYSGTELFRILSGHPEIEEINLYARRKEDNAPRYLNKEVSAFRSIGKELLPYNPEKIMAENDVVFFAVPAGVTSGLAAPYIEKGFPVIDLSGDFRLKDPGEYEKWYGKKAAPKEELEQAFYGLADFYKPDTSYIANPGCYATATILGIAPLLIRHLVKPDSLIVDAKSGVSGSGKKLTETSHYPVINENALLYKVNRHQHVPEILQQLKKFDDEVSALQFSTTLLPITRGIMATVYAKPKEADFDVEQLKKAYEEVYEGRKCVRVLEEGFPQIKDVQYSNYCDIGVAFDEASRTISVVSVIDNLVKGAAGQAVQNMNNYFGLDELCGLPAVPAWP